MLRDCDARLRKWKSKFFHPFYSPHAARLSLYATKEIPYDSKQLDFGTLFWKKTE
jgi:hypothetical protein